MSYHYFNGNF